MQALTRFSNLASNKFLTSSLRKFVVRSGINPVKYQAKLNGSESLKISSPTTDKSFNFNQFWLRDHCRCNQCYNHQTSQRELDLLAIPDNVHITQHNVSDSTLQVAWSDGHTSVYDIPALFSITYEGGTSMRTKTEKLLWNRETAQELLKMPPIPYQELEKRDSTREVLQRLVKYGFTFVEGVPKNFQATIEAADKICRRTTNLYGDKWELGIGMEHQDSGYTNAPLDAHTDNTYFSEPVGVMVFHCIKMEGTGGESLLVDGFNVARTMKETCPDGYRFLSENVTPAQFIEPSEHFLHCDTTFRHHPVSRELEQIRFNLYDRAPLSSLPQTSVKDYYQYLKHLAKIIRNPENELWLKLRPGTMLLFDNFRVLHGRAGFTGTRHLVGTYFSRSDFMSKARALGII